MSALGDFDLRRQRLYWPLLILVALVACLLRFTGLDTAPPGLFRDELEKGYTAFELWHTGRHGVLGGEGVFVTAPLPIFIEVYEGHDRTSAIYQYLSAPIVAMFGLGPLAVRCVAALSGVVMVLLLALLLQPTMGRFASLVGAAHLALAPGALVFSRWAQQGIVAATLTVAGFLLLERGLAAAPRHRRALLVGGALVLGLAAYSYDPLRLVVPMLVVCWLCVAEREALKESRRELFLAAGVFLLPMALLFWFTLSGGAARLSRVGVFADGVGGGALITALKNYLAHFDPRFLFLSGDLNSRHALPGCGLAGLAGALLILAGSIGAVASFFSNRQATPPILRFALLWLLVAPAAAALTREGIPHALRSILMIPALSILAAGGAKLVWIKLTLRPAAAVVALLLLADATQSVAGLRTLAQLPPGPFEAGRVEALRWALLRDPSPKLSAEIPYASYLALFAESTDPADFHERGLAALRTRIVPPAEALQLRPGEVAIVTPQSGLPLSHQEQSALLAVGTDQGIAFLRTWPLDEEPVFRGH